jgi:hypothetical protein
VKEEAHPDKLSGNSLTPSIQSQTTSNSSSDSRNSRTLMSSLKRKVHSISQLPRKSSLSRLLKAENQLRRLRSQRPQ